MIPIRSRAHLLSLRAPFAAICLAIAVAPALAAADDEVNLYSARKEALIKPLLDRFTEDTGITVNLVTGKADALLQRLKNEGPNSPADILLTVDAGNLHRAKAGGLTQSFSSEIVDAAVPATYRDPDGHWTGLSLRARPIMYVKGKVEPSQLSTYEALADPQWQGRICIRSSSNVYNQSLVASIIAADGTEAAQAWAEAIVANMARPPKGGDRDQIKAAAAGQCDIAIANTYYLAGMLKSDDPGEKEPAEKVAVFWPNQPGAGDGRGTHVNVSGAALTAAASNKDAAVKLIEFLVSPESQAWYAEVNGEYPVREGVEISPVLAEWGTFEADDLDLIELGELNGAALMLMDRAGWK
ncbi:Fe(3+) ABC transporter substrate-binding protein [Lamprobacter modestohalophilus]|uniref:Fe(3+) ABC transporter substrate-binding protein n=1 Tax=Lamprobacter modestohalophilus TaxID=1064514 RepID=UPI002ADEC697|nr:Fe(3+) ABC transporter substrate-binding protein [Lamprobacter modestohalophilus]MEA1051361.1 Fe(3+) ABC transporter substrate-binding protein [Lamprobacter modestohalophilus]